MRRLFCAFLVFIFCNAALSAECPIGYTSAQYIQLEYLESTGTQWIDTGYKAPNNSFIKVSGKIAFTSFTTTSQFLIPFGAYRGATPVDFLLNKTSNDSTSGCIELGSNFCFLNLPIIYKNVPFEFSVSLRNGIFTGFVDSQTYEKEFNSSINATDTLALFASKNHGSVSTGYAIASVKVYRWIGYDENDKPVRDFVPAMRLSDGEPGMYDTVSGKFFTNAGTGEFIAGPSAGKLLGTDTDNCAPCPMNTYKDFVGNSECTPCPDALISPSGSKSASECGRVLHVGDKIYHMKSVKQTSPSLHIRDENGNVWYGNLYSEQE